MNENRGSASSAPVGNWLPIPKNISSAFVRKTPGKNMSDTMTDKEYPKKPLREKNAQVPTKPPSASKPDKTMAAPRSRDANAALGTDVYRKYLCRKCFLYGCPFHMHEQESNNFVPKNVDRKYLTPSDKPCSTECYLVKSPNGVKESAGDVWTGDELAMLKALERVFPNNPCVIATTMMTKTCREVDKRLPRSETSSSATGPNKKVNVNTRGWRYQDAGKVYVPCNHEGPCNKLVCSCVNCEKYCNCDADCKYRTRMTCNCKGRCATESCLCVKLLRECDSDHCTCVACKNVNIQKGLGKKLKVGPSAIHGLGVFVDEPCEKADFISEYRGEIITNEEATRRAKTYKKDDCSYLFTLNNEYVLDARDYGNAVRYLNYSISPNCGAKVLRVNGDHRIGIFASCAIAAGEELTLDYCTFDPTKDQ